MTLSMMALNLALLLQGEPERSFWLPSRSSTASAETDWVFYLIYWISVFFFVLITALMVYFVIRYRRRPGRMKAEKSAHHSTALEVVWTIIPIGIVILMFWGGFQAFLNLTTAPGNTFDIYVTGQKWKWLFEYPNGYVAEELHVPLDQPVRLVMTSEDVIHSFYIPDFRTKKDVVPGRYTNMWFEATKTGTFRIFCAEYCGTSHSDMITQVVVHEPAEFENWLEQAASFIDTMPPADAGEYLYTKYGCNQCHSADGSANTGPTFFNSFNYDHEMKDGTSVLVDENYVRDSILNPADRVRAGYDAVMPTFQGKLKENEIRYLIAYIKSLSDKVSDEEKSLLRRVPEEGDDGESEGSEAEGAPDDGESAGVDGESAGPGGETEDSETGGAGNPETEMEEQEAVAVG